MATPKSIGARHFRIPLDVSASDSTRGVVTSFELISVRVTGADGQEGVGCTCTTGHNGVAIHHLLARETMVFLGLEARRANLPLYRLLGGHDARARC